MSFEARYIEIFDYLKTILEGMKDAQGNPLFKQVEQGWKEEITATPLAMVFPDPDFLEVGSVAADVHNMRFIITICVEDEDVTAGLKSAISLGLKVYEKLVSDRHLTKDGKKLVDNLEVTRSEFVWKQVRGYARHWLALYLECHLYWKP